VAQFDRREIVAVFLGGALGSLLRVWLGHELATGTADWPWVTFAVNASGSFVLGYMAARMQAGVPETKYRRLFVGTGFCGAYTTFSTMQIEILGMVDGGRLGLAVAYAVSSVATGYVAIAFATTLGRRVQGIA